MKIATTILLATTLLALPSALQAQGLAPKTNPPASAESQQPRTTTGAVGTNRVKEPAAPDKSGEGDPRPANPGTGSSSSKSVDPKGPNAPKDDVKTDASGRLIDSDGKPTDTVVQPNNPARGTAGTTGRNSAVSPQK